MIDIQAPDRPLPRPSELTRPFWEAARDHRLVRPYCAACDGSFFPPALCCPGCLDEGWVWTASNGIGEVYSYTTVNRAPSPGFDTPYVIGVVDLEPGFSMMTNLVGDAAEHATVGMSVMVSWLDQGEITLPVFVVADDASEMGQA